MGNWGIFDKGEEKQVGTMIDMGLVTSNSIFKNRERRGRQVWAVSHGQSMRRCRLPFSGLRPIRSHDGFGLLPLE